MLVSIVHPAEMFSGVFCIVRSFVMFVVDEIGIVDAYSGIGWEGSSLLGTMTPLCLFY